MTTPDWYIMMSHTPQNTNVMMAFTADQMARLTEISTRQLRYWEKSGVFDASRVESPVTGPYQKLYSYQDLVNLRVMARLRMELGVPLGEIREISRYVRRYAGHPWSSLALRVYGTHLEFRDPVSGNWMTANPIGQLTLEVEFSAIEAESEQLVKQLFTRPADDIGNITQHRNIMSNLPVFAGTRIPVRAVKSFMDEGYADAEILRQYPTLRTKDLAAARAFLEQSTTPA